MPLTFATGAVLAQNTAFQDRVAMAMYYVARGIIANAEDPEMGYEKRRGFARAVVLQEFSALRRYSLLVASDPIVVAQYPTVAVTAVDQALVTDSHLINAISLAWNALADVSV